MSILPTKKHKLTKEEQLEETKIRIKDMQMNLNRDIRFFLKVIQSLEEKRKKAEERNYTDIEKGLATRIENITGFTRYCDRTIMYLDQVSLDLDMSSEMGKVGSILIESEKIFEAFKITPEQQMNVIKSLGDFESIANNNLNAMDAQMERINSSLGFNGNTESSSSQNILLDDLLNDRPNKSNASGQKRDEIDSVLDKRNVEHE